MARTRQVMERTTNHTQLHGMLPTTQQQHTARNAKAYSCASKTESGTCRSGRRHHAQSAAAAGAASGAPRAAPPAATRETRRHMEGARGARAAGAAVARGRARPAAGGRRAAGGGRGRRAAGGGARRGRSRRGRRERHVARTQRRTTTLASDEPQRHIHVDQPGCGVLEAARRQRPGVSWGSVRAARRGGQGGVHGRRAVWARRTFYLDTHKQSPAAARALSCRSRGRALCLAPWQSQTSISVGCGAAMVDSRLVQDRPTTRAACAVGSRRRCGRGLPRRGSRWKRSYSAAWARA